MTIDQLHIGDDVEIITDKTRIRRVKKVHLTVPLLILGAPIPLPRSRYLP